MSRTAAKRSKKPTRLQLIENAELIQLDKIPTRTIKALPLVAKTENQKRYIAAIKSSILTFGIGPAGTGKTYIAGALAAEAFQDKQVERVIITRPAVDAGESLGFLPGELSEKYAPYIAPFQQVLEERLGKARVGYMMKSGTLEAQPLAYMRGRTFKDAFVILDEAQNVTPDQMKMFLTRIGENCTVVIDGDPTQQDIRGTSGLLDAVKRLSWIPSVRVVSFELADVVRSGLVGDVIQSYSKRYDD